MQKIIFAIGSLVPRPPPLVVLWFVFSIIHGCRRAVKNREGLGWLITWVDTKWT